MMYRRGADNSSVTDTSYSTRFAVHADMNHEESKTRRTAGAPSKLDRNSQWLAEVEAGEASVRQIADREFVSPGAVRKALKLALQARNGPVDDTEEGVTALFQKVYCSVRAWAAVRGIEVQERSLPRDKAGEFTGTHVLMNNKFGWEERSYYLAHAVGSIVCWSLDKPGVQRFFDGLRAAKEHREANAAELSYWIEQFRAFETRSSQFAAWLLEELEYPAAKESYSNFMRADLEAMTEFHRTGHAPGWRMFFARWNREVASGQRVVASFEPKIIPPFHPVRLEKQEILQPQGEGEQG
jgi:hypothetical protein